MKPATKSILEELNEIAQSRSIDAIIEGRALNIIKSSINLIETFYKHYPEETALELERRLINSIRGSDVNKFTRGIKKLSESKATRPIDRNS